MAGGEVHRGERAVMDAQRHLVAVQDVEHVEDAAGAADESEYLGDMDGVARPGVGEQFAELRALEGVEAAGGARVLLEDDRVFDPGLVQDEVLAGCGLLVGRDPLVGGFVSEWGSRFEVMVGVTFWPSLRCRFVLPPPMGLPRGGGLRPPAGGLMGMSQSRSPGCAAFPTSAPPTAINSRTLQGNLGGVNGLAPIGPPGILASLGVSFRLREHPDVTSPVEVCVALGVPLERTVKTLAFVIPEDRLLLAALPGHARLRYGALARAAGVRRGDLSPAGVGRLARAGMRPGGVCPVSADRAAMMVFDGTVGSLGRVQCGSGQPGSSIEIEAAELMAAVPGAAMASIADLRADGSA